MDRCPFDYQWSQEAYILHVFNAMRSNPALLPWDLNNMPYWIYQGILTCSEHDTDQPAQLAQQRQSLLAQAMAEAGIQQG